MRKKDYVYLESLNSEQRSQLKGLAHHLKPVVQIGAQGFSENVKKEILLALDKHELIKVQLPADTDANSKDSKDYKDKMQNILVDLLPKHAHLVSRIGRMVILYYEKKPEEQKIQLSSQK